MALVRETYRDWVPFSVCFMISAGSRTMAASTSRPLA